MAEPSNGSQINSTISNNDLAPNDIGVVSATLLDSQHPWPGLNSFTEANASFFFGREREVEDIGRMVQQEIVTVLYGKSGLGKSSILRAGVTPLLKKTGFIPIYIRFNHFEETLPLEDQVEVYIEKVTAAENIDAPRPVREETLWEYFHKQGSNWWSDDNLLVKPVLIFDQFEELLTIGQENPQRAKRCAAFLTELEDLVENRPPAKLQERFKIERGLAKNYHLDRLDYRVVLSLREDYLADVESLRERLRLIMLNRYRLRPMSGEQALNVISKPGGHLVENDVAVQIVDFVSEAKVSNLATKAERSDMASRQVEPTLLSVILRELNNRRIQSGSDTISSDLVLHSKPAEILTDFYERGLEGLDKTVREFIEQQLLTASGARNRTAEEDALSLYNISETAITTLINRRIIQRDSTGKMKWLELTHDSLAEVVRNGRTLSQQRKKMETVAAREREARKQLARTRKLVGSFAVLTLLAAFALVFAYYKNNELRHTTRELVSQKERLVNLAEAQTKDIVDAISHELTNPSPGGGERTTNYLQKVVEDAEVFATPKLKISRVVAHVLASELYFANGLIKEGIANAAESASLLGQLSDSALSLDHRELIQARISYVTGLGLKETGALTKAEPYFSKALSTTEQLISSEGNTPLTVDITEIYQLRAKIKIGLGNLYVLLSDYDKSRDVFNKLSEWANSEDLPTSTENKEIWQIHALLGLGSSQEKTFESTAYFQRAQKILENKIQHDPDNFIWRQLAAETAYRRGFAMLDFAPYYDTTRQVKEAVSIGETLHNLDSKNMAWSLIQVKCLRVMGMLHQTGGAIEKARASFTRMQELSSLINEYQPGWIDSSYQHAISNYYLGKLALSSNQNDRLASYLASVRELTAITEASEYVDYFRSLALQHAELGKHYHDKKEEPDYALALNEYQNALNTIDKIPEKVRNKSRYREILAWTYFQIGRSYLKLEDDTKASQAFEEAMLQYENILSDTNQPGTFSDIARIRLWLGDILFRAGKKQEATAEYDKAINTIDQGLTEHPHDPILVEQKIRDYWHILDELRKNGSWQRSIAFLDALATTAQQVFQHDPVQLNLYKLLESIDKYANKYGLNIEQEITDSSTELSKAIDISKLKSNITTANNKLDLNKLLWPQNGGYDKNHLIVKSPRNSHLLHILTGTWRELSPEEVAKEIKTDEVQKMLESNPDSPSGKRITRIHTRPLSFYPDTMLYEAEVILNNRSQGTLTYLRHPTGTVHISGTSPEIHKLNATGILRLETWQQAADYLRFFTNSIQGDVGVFRVVEHISNIPLLPHEKAEDFEYLAKLTSPMRLKQTKDGSWDFQATILYGSDMFYALLRVKPTGGVEMYNDNPIAAGLPVKTEYYDDGIRHLRELKWSNKITKQKAAIEKILKSDEKDKAKKLKGKYLSLSWYQLLSSKFSDVLASVKEGKKWNPEYLPLDTNEAHAHLFLGSTAEAEAIYLKNIGEIVGGKQWHQAILDDFIALENAKVSHPGFAAIRKQLKAAAQKR